MSARLPRRGPRRRAAAREAGPPRCRLAAVLAGLTCALLASAAVPAAFATTLPDGGPLAAGAPAAAATQQDQPGRPATASPCSEVCSGGGYASGTSTTTAPAYDLSMILLAAGAPGPCSEVCSGGGYGFSAGIPGPCSEVCSGGGYGPGGPPPRTPAGSSAGNTARALPQGRVVTGSAGFHWGDAGIGAGGMLTVIVLGLGAALTLTHRRNYRSHDQRRTGFGRLWAAQSAAARGAAGPSGRSPGEGGRGPDTDVPPGTDLITF